MIVGLPWKVVWDLYTFLGNCPPMYFLFVKVTKRKRRSLGVAPVSLQIAVHRPLRLLQTALLIPLLPLLQSWIRTDQGLPVSISPLFSAYIGEILWSDRVNETYLAKPFSKTISFTVFYRLVFWMLFHLFPISFMFSLWKQFFELSVFCSKSKKRPASGSKKGIPGEEGSPASKKPCVSPAPSAGGAGGGSRTSTPTPTGSEEGPQGITEEAMRRYLTRKPMTSKDLLQKFKSKRTGLSNDETVKKLASIVRKIQPEQKTIKGKLYLLLKPQSSDLRARRSLVLSHSRLKGQVHRSAHADKLNYFFPIYY